jgi:undecaprenyl-diphosphatase
MALFSVRPTKLDRVVAGKVAAHTNPQVEQVAEILTWGADEKVICVAAAAWWLYCRGASEPRRRFSDHVLICSLIASVLPHLLKIVIDQERPDRLTFFGHWRGIPRSGRKYDAFPSGHAVHIGALAGAATLLPRRQRAAVWSLSGILAATRVALLAHWPSDVVAGLGIGALAERLLRRLTLNPPARDRAAKHPSANSGAR